MSQPGTKSPDCCPTKDGAETRLPQPNSKCLDEDMLRFGQASDVGVAPTSRIYTRDYKKVGREPDDTDLVTAALGNPLGL